MGRHRVPNNFKYDDKDSSIAYLILISGKYADATVTLDNDPDAIRMLDMVKWYPSQYPNTSPTARMTNGSMLNLTRAVAALSLPPMDVIYSVTLKKKCLDYRLSNMFIHHGPHVDGYDGLPDCAYKQQINRYQLERENIKANSKLMNDYINVDEMSPANVAKDIAEFASRGKVYELTNASGELCSLEEYTIEYNKTMRERFNVK